MPRNLNQVTPLAAKHAAGLQPIPPRLTAAASLGAIDVTPCAGDLPSPTGIDYHEPTDTLVMAVNFPTGAPHNLIRVLRDGTRVPFSRLSGLTDAIRIAAARAPLADAPSFSRRKAFAPGDVFVASRNSIIRVTDNGNSVIDGWAAVPGAGGAGTHVSLQIDTTGQWNGDLMVATGAGQIWRINTIGELRLVADLRVRLAGIATVPDDPTRYGALAGRVLAGNETNGRVYAVDPTGAFRFWTVTDELGERVDIGDIRIAARNQNLFGIDFVTGAVSGCAAEAMAPLAGEILLSDPEFPVGASGLYRLSWDFAAIRPIAQRIGLAGTAPLDWESIAFAPVGLGDLLPALQLSAN